MKEHLVITISILETHKSMVSPKYDARQTKTLQNVCILMTSPKILPLIISNNSQ